MVQGTSYCCIAILPAVVATLGIGSSILSTVWCEAIKFAPDTSDAPDFLTGQTRSVMPDGFATWKFGLYYHSQIEEIQVTSVGESILRVTDSCVYYADDVDMDAAWKTARAFAVIAPVVAGIFAIGLYMAPCCIFYTKATWNTMACFFCFVIPALQSITLLFLTSDACKANPVIESRISQFVQSMSDTTISTTEAPAGNATGVNATTAETEDLDVIADSRAEEALRGIYASDCEWDWGMYGNLLSLILFFVCGVIMLAMGAPTRPPPKEPEIQTIEYEQKVDDAGEEVVQEVDVTKETYDPNGPSWANTAPSANPY